MTCRSVNRSCFSTDSFARRMDRLYTGSAIETRMRIKLTTIIISINVNPRLFLRARLIYQSLYLLPSCAVLSDFVYMSYTLYTHIECDVVSSLIASMFHSG